ncbi:formate dehydrogenase, partial [Thioclava sp. BHET1]
MKIYVPRDAATKALGGEEVAAEILAQAKARGLDVTLVRNGTRGMIWLEPLVEVATEEGRMAFGPVTKADVASLFEAEFGEHPLSLGLTEELPWMVEQT